MSELDLLDDDLDLNLLENAGNKTAQTLITTSNHCSKPLSHRLDETLLATYVYPTNLPIRDYQYLIVNRALFHNVLVALPTGLGKTFIASTVMLNYNRWFPDLKIIFMAPTKPLVAQQIKACCGIAGIPSSKVAILLDRTRKNRRQIWDEKSVFFTTPQVVENDLTSGIVDPKLIVLLVIDEAHRARGNYAYNNVVKFISRFTSSFRILALTATPASDVDGVQEIVDNLHISFVEVRTERSIDIFRYLKRKKVERITADINSDVQRVLDSIAEAAAPLLRQANEKGIYDVTDPYKINAFTALDAQRKLRGIKNMPEGLLWANYFLLQVLVVIGQCFRRLHVYGVRTFYSYFKEKYSEFTTKYNAGKSKNGTAAKFYFNPSIKKVVSMCDLLVADPLFLGSLKLEITVSEVALFFENTVNNDSRVIIFTELRQSALDIVDAIARSDPEKERLRPHIFIGQAKEKEKFDEEKFLSKGKKKKLAKNDEEPKKKALRSSDANAPQTSSELAQQSGMNQKRQKEVIREFKDGTINILVATSIGEEGLDIGEVDLIICYDSTSSPIKNIQRMGRTGRNRDGKVILLFSSNEESKFDKAMAGYEFIQQHIMKGLVQMNEQNRLIPSRFNPVVEEQEIEIPKENLEIKEEEDEDEIIRIATKHMTQTQHTNKAPVKTMRGKKGKKDEKIEKRFFMPDAVELGFRLAGLVLHTEDAENAKRRRIEEHGLDFLDSLLDSEDETPNLKPVETAVMLKEVDSLVLSPVTKVSKSVVERGEAVDSSLPSARAIPPLPAGSLLSGKSRKLLGPGRLRVKQPEIFNWRSNFGVLELRRSVPSKFSSDDVVVKVDVDSVVKESIDKPIDQFPSDDDFSDDDDILMLAKRTQTLKDGEKIRKEGYPEISLQTPPQVNPALPPKPNKNTNEPSPKDVFEPIYSSTDPGVLSEEQKKELYLHYYTEVERSPTNNFCNTLGVSHKEMIVGHSSKALKHISYQDFLKKLSNLKAEELLEIYDTMATDPTQTVPSIIQLNH